MPIRLQTPKASWLLCYLGRLQNSFVVSVETDLEMEFFSPESRGYPLGIGLVEERYGWSMITLDQKIEEQIGVGDNHSRPLSIAASTSSGLPKR